MPCNPLLSDDGDVVGFVCTRGRSAPSCDLCRKPSQFLCDMPMEERYKSGKKKGQKKTCDKRLCSDHVRHGVTKGIDFCPQHYEIAKAAYERRMANK